MTSSMVAQGYIQLFFADDTNLFISGNDTDIINREINCEMSNINNWFTANKLVLNLDKTCYMLHRQDHTSCENASHSSSSSATASSTLSRTSRPRRSRCSASSRLTAKSALTLPTQLASWMWSPSTRPVRTSVWSTTSKAASLSTASERKKPSTSSAKSARCALPEHPRRAHHPLPWPPRQGQRYHQGRHPFGTGKITDHIKFDSGHLCMITGGRNLGRVGTITHREKHPGSFEIVHIKDASDHTFATRLSNVFVIGKSNKPYVSLPKGKGIRLTIAEEREKRIAQRQ